MKTKNRIYYVYQLMNDAGVPEYVGETTNPLRRLDEHTKKLPNPKYNYGKFYGRTDIKMQIVGQFPNKLSAYRYQIQLQKAYGLPTDTRNNGKYPHPWLRKLTQAQAEQIRRDYQYRVRGKGMKCLADKYGVQIRVIYLIIHNKTYVTQNETGIQGDKKHLLRKGKGMEQEDGVVKRAQPTGDTRRRNKNTKEKSRKNRVSDRKQSGVQSGTRESNAPQFRTDNNLDAKKATK